MSFSRLSNPAVFFLFGDWSEHETRTRRGTGVVGWRSAKLGPPGEAWPNVAQAHLALLLQGIGFSDSRFRLAGQLRWPASEVPAERSLDQCPRPCMRRWWQQPCGMSLSQGQAAACLARPWKSLAPSSSLLSADRAGDAAQVADCSAQQNHLSKRAPKRRCRDFCKQE